MIAERCDEEWQVTAACRGPQAAAFYPPAHVERKEERTARERAAKEICRRCPVKRPCLEFAMQTREPHGIWGGLNKLERKQLLDRRAG